MSLSPQALAMTTAEASEDVLVDLLTFYGADIEPPIRLTSDKTTLLSYDGPVALFGTRSREAGRVDPEAADELHTFSYVAFSLIKPGYREDATPEIRIGLDLIKREAILPLLRTYREDRIRCLVETVRAADPDTVIDRYKGLFLRMAPATMASVQLVLQMTRYDTESYPVGEMTPSSFPGIFF